jgi:hypothetical protein
MDTKFCPPFTTPTIFSSLQSDIMRRIRIRIPRIQIRIRIQFRIQSFDDQKLKKITAVKLFFIFFKSKIAIYLSLGLHKGLTSYRRSLEPSKENIQHFQNMRILYFFYICGSFLPSWIRIRIQQLKLMMIHADSDTDPQL